MKECAKCGVEKPDGSFQQRSNHESLQSYCKDCVREYKRKYYKAKPEKCRGHARDSYHRHAEERKPQMKAWKEENRFKYAITCARTYALRKGHEPCCATVDEIEAEFDGKCAICHTPEMECSKKLCMDHDHETGEFRGWLCDRCNKALGFLRDSREVALNALLYLQRKETSPKGI